MNNEDIIQAMGQMTIPQIVELTKDLENKWGIQALPQTPQLALPPSNLLLQKEEQTEFNVILSSFPADKKIAVIKILREILGVGLLEAKGMVEVIPKMIKEAVSSEEAELVKFKLTEAGAVVVIS